MSIRIVAITVDKVQTFLYDVLNAHIQENQSNSDTLQAVMRSSQFISEQFYVDIGVEGDSGVFEKASIEHRLLMCSGMCVFSTKLDQTQIEQRLNNLFQQYYLKFKGQLLLKFTYFEHDLFNDADKLKAISESKRLLRKKDCLNRIIAQNRELLFQFSDHSTENKDTSCQTGIRSTDSSVFTTTINKLFSEKESDNDNHFRIAVIKADLDGLGTLFERIEDYHVYAGISRLLSEKLSMEYLIEQTALLQKEQLAFKLYPLYIAGDDIFFAVSVSHLMDGVDLCKRILNEINKGIHEIIGSSRQSIALVSMSIGIDFTFNREPIRYYYERVQRQLELAKQAGTIESLKNSKSSYGIKLCINNFVFYDYGSLNVKDKMSTDDKPNWRHFVHHVKRLKSAMEAGFAAHHFFYSLLEKITNPAINGSTIKYSNAVLYHLLPHCVGKIKKTEREGELLLLEALMNQLIVKPIKSTKGERGEGELSFEPEQRERLERYVRLMLLFSDPRFNLVQVTRNNNEKPEKFEQEHSARIRSTLFNKTMRYLYRKSLDESLVKEKLAAPIVVKSLRGKFIRSEKYAPQSSVNASKDVKIDHRKQPEVYRTIKLSSSALHRIKRLMHKEKIGIEIISDMIEALNPQSQEEVSELEKRREQEDKAPPGLHFDKMKFRQLASQSTLWNEDYVDTLLIFYQLKELSIQYKMMYPKPKNNHHKNNGKHFNGSRTHNSNKKFGRKGPVK